MQASSTQSSDVARDHSRALGGVQWSKPGCLVCVLLASGSLIAAGCEADLSCIDTATCAPTVFDAGPDSAASDIRASDNLGDAPASASVDGAASDVSPADRADSGAIGDAFIDKNSSADVATRDSDASEIGGGSRFDASQDARTEVDGAMGELDVRVERDVSFGIDAVDAPLPDGNGEPPDANGSSDSPATDSTDAANVVDAVDACTQNACGGCAVLAGVPQTACGTCGTYTCNGPDSVTCSNDAPLNACGGCGTLAGAPGASCGSCGVYACSSDKASVYCDHPDPLKVTQLTAGEQHTCALLSTGSVRCWGLNVSGQLGNGSNVSTSQIPTGDVLTNVVSLGAGELTTCAVMTSGGVRCWGNNSYGQLGNSTSGGGTSSADLYTPPTSDIANLKGVSAVSVGEAHACALSSGDLWCWGHNNATQLGDSGADRSIPVSVSLSGVTAFGLARDNTCAMAGGTARCWGAVGNQLGDGVLAELAGGSMIDTGGSHSCAVDAQLNARCWGSNYYGQLGDGTTIDHANATPLIWGGVTSLAVGGDFVCAVSGGKVVCWGNNHYGQLGESSTVTPTRTAPGPAVVQGATSVVAGFSHACASLQSGSVKCWGYDATTNKGNEAPFDIAPFCP